MPVAFITGIAGQDGSYLAESLLRRGFDVHGTVRRSSDASVLRDHPRLTIHEIDLVDTVGLAGTVEDVEPDEVYCLASISSVFQSWQQPVDTAKVNALSVVQILDSSMKVQETTGRRVKVVHASSAEIFGHADMSPQNEETPVQPVSPYGSAKAFAHRIVQIYRTRDLFATNCILYNHESPRRPESFVTRKITVAAARIARGLQDELSLGTLESRRDWGWAPDYVHAMELALNAGSATDYVVATGQTRSVGDFVEAAFNRAGILNWRDHVRIDETFSRPNDPAEQKGDSSKAENELGWTRSKSFEELVAAMVDHDLELLDLSS